MINRELSDEALQEMIKQRGNELQEIHKTAALIKETTAKMVNQLNEQGEMIDNIEAHVVKCVGNSDKKLSEDALRILRAVRFATKLRFRLDQDVVSAIKRHKRLLKNISYERKKEELDKIFTSSNIQYGISLLLDLGLDEVLEIPKLKDVTYTDSLIGIWTILDVDNILYQRT